MAVSALEDVFSPVQLNHGIIQWLGFGRNIKKALIELPDDFYLPCYERLALKPSFAALEGKVILGENVGLVSETDSSLYYAYTKNGLIVIMKSDGSELMHRVFPRQSFYQGNGFYSYSKPRSFGEAETIDYLVQSGMEPTKIFDGDPIIYVIEERYANEYFVDLDATPSVARVDNPKSLTLGNNGHVLLTYSGITTYFAITNVGHLLVKTGFAPHSVTRKVNPENLFKGSLYAFPVRHEHLRQSELVYLR